MTPMYDCSAALHSICALHFHPVLFSSHDLMFTSLGFIPRFSGPCSLVQDARAHLSPVDCPCLIVTIHSRFHFPLSICILCSLGLMLSELQTCLHCNNDRIHLFVYYIDVYNSCTSSLAPLECLYSMLLRRKRISTR